MTRETRLALLVGLAFIILFGLVLGERSLRLAPTPRGRRPVAAYAPVRPGAEVITAGNGGEEHRAALSPSRRVERRAPPTQPPRPAQPVPSGRQRTPAVPSRGLDGAVPAPASSGAPSVPRRTPATPPSVATYTVLPGDTLIKIARRFWGRQREKQYRRIYEANRDRLTDVSRLAVGQVLVIPPIEAGPRRAARRPAPAAGGNRPQYTELTLQALARRLEAPKAYTVQPGDSLTAIARRQMGDGSSRTVRELYRANRDRISDPDNLAVGLELRIPR